MMSGSIIARHYAEEHYRILFNQKTGFMIRCEDPGFSEPLWSKHGPELLDVSITNYCERACDFCYRASSREGKHLRFKDYLEVLKQAVDAGVLQIALGGGNPNQHPDFPRILSETRARGIVPSYTTNGDGLTEEILSATAMYCGAIAISYYPSKGSKYYEQLFEICNHKKIKANLHVIISPETMDAIEALMIGRPEWLKYVNAIIFLNFKPVGRGRIKPMKQLDPERAASFFRFLGGLDRKIGFDSCSISGIVKWMNVKPELIEACEAARFSAFVSEDMKMYPCSFMIDTGGYGDLRKESLLNIWQNNECFKSFRDKKSAAHCFGCPHSNECRGGCRLFEGINFC